MIPAAGVFHRQLKPSSSQTTARPAAARVQTLKEKHAFKTEMDDEARRAMFPSNVPKVA